MDPQFVQALEELLKQLTASPDSARIRAATATLSSKFFSTPSCVPALVLILQKSQEPHVRHLAAVELRKRASKYWPQVDAASRETIKAGLLECILQEPEKSVRHSTAQVISTIAKVEVPAQRWASLVQFIQSCCQAPLAGHREVGYYVLFSLFDVVGEVFAEHMQELLAMFANGLCDPESKEVRVTTLQALGKVAEFVEPENKRDIARFRELIPSMVAVLQQSLQDEDEDAASKGFEVFDNMLVLEAPLLTKHISEIVRFFLDAAANTTHDGSLRCMALNFITWVVVYQKQKIVRLKLQDPILASIFPIMAEDDSGDADEDIPSRLATHIVDSLSQHLPPQQCIPQVMEHIHNYMQNPNPGCRKAALRALAVLTEGSADYVRKKIEHFVPMIQHGLQDPSDIVRRSACMALGCMADELPEEICAQHASFLPLIFNLMNDENEDTKKSACNALDSFLEGIAGDIVPYMAALMEKLLALVDSVSGNLLCTVIGAIGSAAHASGELFQPYFPLIIVRLQQMMAINDAKSMDGMMLRGVATDTAGIVMEAVGKDMARPYMADLMARAGEGLHLRSARLRECSYCFFGIIARLFGPEFTPYLAHIVPQLIKTCQLKETNDPDASAKAAFDGRSGDEEEEDLEIDDGDENERSFNAGSAISDEKEIAADALGEIFSSLKVDFLPYVHDTLDELIKLTDHHAEGVRKATMGSLFKYLETFHRMSHDAKWVAGLPVKIPINENISNMIKLVIPAILRMWKDEYDKTVVNQICSELVESVKLVGPALIAETVDEIAGNCLELFEKKALCQEDNDDEDEEMDEEEQAEQDSLLLSMASELVGALALVLGPNFVPYMKGLMPKICKYYKKAMDASDRAMAVGCMSECIEGLGPSSTEFAPDLFKLFDRALTDEADNVASNAAFGMGMLIKNTETDLSSQYPGVLGKLHALFGRSIPSLSDNACGAVARMILRNPSALPIDQVLPVFLQVLPLKADFAENQPVFECLFALFKSENAFVFSHLSRFLAIFASTLSSEDQLTAETRSQLVVLLRQLSSGYPGFQAASSALPNDQQQVLMQATQST